MDKYNIQVLVDGGIIEIDWGNAPGWMESNKEYLERATHISLVPKNGIVNMPTVVVKLDGTKRWVAFSRIYRQASSSLSVRLYTIGWQDTISGKNVKSLNWIYPDGTVELAEEPTVWRDYMR